MHVIVLFGLPGSGKGTNAHHFRNMMRICNVGDLLRARAKQKDEIGERINQHLASGQLIDWITVRDMVNNCLLSFMNMLSSEKKYLARPIFSQEDKDLELCCQQCMILDGYPRSMEQARDLGEWAAQHNAKIHVMHFILPMHIACERLLNRKTCANCWYTMNIKIDICPICKSSELYKRADDNPAAIKTRLDIYEQSVNSLCKYYIDKNIKIYEINTNKAVDLVYNEMKGIIRIIGATQ